MKVDGSPSCPGTGAKIVIVYQIGTIFSRILYWGCEFRTLTAALVAESAWTLRRGRLVQPEFPDRQQPRRGKRKH